LVQEKRHHQVLEVCGVPKEGIFKEWKGRESPPRRTKRPSRGLASRNWGKVMRGLKVEGREAALGALQKFS
jgi:hypothetical protein